MRSRPLRDREGHREAGQDLLQSGLDPQGRFWRIGAGRQRHDGLATFDNGHDAVEGHAGHVCQRLGLRPGVREPYATATAGAPDPRYGRQRSWICDAASVMKSAGAGGRGRTCGCICASSGSRSPLRRLHGAHDATTFSQTESRTTAAGYDVVERQPAGRAAVLAAPPVPGEERPP